MRGRVILATVPLMVAFRPRRRNDYGIVFRGRMEKGIKKKEQKVNEEKTVKEKYECGGFSQLNSVRIYCPKLEPRFLLSFPSRQQFTIHSCLQADHGCGFFRFHSGATRDTSHLFFVLPLFLHIERSSEQSQTKPLRPLTSKYGEATTHPRPRA